MITAYRWQKLKDGDQVWVYASWMKFPMPGIVKKTGREKYVYINFFGDCQTCWRPSDPKRMLREIYIRKNDAEEAART